MQQSNSNNEKIRNILAAMEKSIDVARRKRLNTSGDIQDTADDPPTQSPSHEPSASTEEQETRRVPNPPSINGNGHCEDAHDKSNSPEPPAPGTDNDPPRQKARPKRPSTFFHPRGEAAWQSRVG